MDTQPASQNQNTDFSRVNVVGTSGSGKSTFSTELAAKLGHPRVEMDALFWEPNWTQPTDEVFFEKLKTALEQPNWVLDGNYDRTLAIKWANVTTVVWIDFSFRRTLFQAIRRAFVRSLHPKELWPNTGNKESLRKSFMSKDSIILWMLKTYSKVQTRYEQRMNEDRYKHIKFIRLKSPKEAQRFLNSLPRRLPPGEK